MSGFELLIGLAGTAVSAYSAVVGAETTARVAEHNAEVERMAGIAQFAGKTEQIYGKAQDFKVAVSKMREGMAHQGGSLTQVPDVYAPMLTRERRNEGMLASEGENQEQYAFDKARTMDIGAKYTREAGWLTGLGTLLSGSAKAAHAMNGPTSSNPWGTDNDDLYGWTATG